VLPVLWFCASCVRIDTLPLVVNVDQLLKRDLLDARDRCCCRATVPMIPFLVVVAVEVEILNKFNLHFTSVWKCVNLICNLRIITNSINHIKWHQIINYKITSHDKGFLCKKSDLNLN